MYLVHLICDTNLLVPTLTEHVPDLAHSIQGGVDISSMFKHVGVFCVTMTCGLFTGI